MVVSNWNLCRCVAYITHLGSQTLLDFPEISFKKCRGWKISFLNLGQAQTFEVVILFFFMLFLHRGPHPASWCFNIRILPKSDLVKKSYPNSEDPWCCPSSRLGHTTLTGPGVLSLFTFLSDFIFDWFYSP